MDILSIVIELLVGVVVGIFVGMFLEWRKKKRRLSVEVQRYQNTSDANFAAVLEVLKQLAVAALDKDKVQKVQDSTVRDANTEDTSPTLGDGGHCDD